MLARLRSTTLIKLLLLVAAAGVFLAGCLQQGERVPVTLTAAETPEPIAEKVSTKKFERFSHQIAEHKQFECASCHGREGRSTKLEYAGHDSCVGCHLNQFTDRALMDKDKTMCSICHNDLTANPPTMKAFPVGFREGFNMKFDHASHDNGAGRPRDGCAACHNPSGPGMTIPSGIDTHATCFACHTAESKIGSCSVCHELGPYNRTLQSEYNFKAMFRHGDHTSASCSECHNVVPGARAPRQVTNIAILQHRTSPGNNCLQCHNGRRAFTGNNPFAVTTCIRCHKGMGATTPLPPETYPDEAVEE